MGRLSKKVGRLLKNGVLSFEELSDLVVGRRKPVGRVSSNGKT